MHRSYDLFLKEGNVSLQERQQIGERLDAIKAEVASNFPLTDAEAAAMRAELREHVLRLRDAEITAVTALAEAIGYKMPESV
jgi:hypothetical protein